MSTVATGGRSKQRDRVVRAILPLAGRVRPGWIRVNPAQRRDRANAVELLRGLCVKGELGLSWDIPTRRRRGERGTGRKSKRDRGRKQYGLYVTLSSRDRPVLMARSGGFLVGGSVLLGPVIAIRYWRPVAPQQLRDLASIHAPFEWNDSRAGMVSTWPTSLRPLTEGRVRALAPRSVGRVCVLGSSALSIPRLMRLARFNWRAARHRIWKCIRLSCARRWGIVTDRLRWRDAGQEPRPADARIRP
jgi:hypothetical protein